MVLKVGLAAVLSLTAVAGHVLPRQAPSCAIIPSDFRTDCGSTASTSTSCEASGCCWSPVSDGGAWCYQPTPRTVQRPSIPSRADIDAFVQTQLPYAKSHLEANLSPAGAKPGAVVAATTGLFSPVPSS
ncbi:hypothetical protein BDK51DRAFT_52695, partial [Blyttiomyces helicus]